MGFAKDDDMVEAFPADRADKPLRMPVLPIPIAPTSHRSAPGLGDVVTLACREDEAHRQAQPADGEVDFAGQAAARAADRL